MSTSIKNYDETNISVVEKRYHKSYFDTLATLKEFQYWINTYYWITNCDPNKIIIAACTNRIEFTLSWFFGLLVIFRLRIDFTTSFFLFPVCFHFLILIAIESRVIMINDRKPMMGTSGVSGGSSNMFSNSPVHMTYEQ